MPLPPRYRNEVNSSYLPACGFPAPGGPAEIAPTRGTETDPATREVRNSLCESKPMRLRCFKRIRQLSVGDFRLPCFPKTRHAPQSHAYPTVQTAVCIAAV